MEFLLHVFLIQVSPLVLLLLLLLLQVLRWNLKGMEVMQEQC